MSEEATKERDGRTERRRALSLMTELRALKRRAGKTKAGRSRSPRGKSKGAARGRMNEAAVQAAAIEESDKFIDIVIVYTPRAPCGSGGTTLLHQSGWSGRICGSELAADCPQNPRRIRLPSLSLGGLAGHHHMGQSSSRASFSDSMVLLVPQGCISNFVFRR